MKESATDFDPAELREEQLKIREDNSKNMNTYIAI